MKYVIPFLIILALTSCKSKEEQLKESILPVLTNAIVQDSLVHKIDSIKILKIDTLTDSLYAERRLLNKSKIFDYYLSRSKMYQTQAELDGQSAKLSQQQSTLYYEYLNSSTLSRMSADDAKSKIASLKENLAKSTVYIDSAKKVNAEMQKIENDLKIRKNKPKGFRGFLVTFNLLGTDKKNMEIKKDSMLLYLSPALRVLPINKI